MEEGVVHQHVDIIVVARHLDVILPPHESKSCPHLDEEFLDVFCQSNLNVTFVVLVGESQHIKDIRVFEHGLHVIRFDCGKCCVKIVGKRTMLVVVVEFDSLGEITARLMVDNTLCHIPVTGTDVLDLLDEENIM